MRIKVQEIDYHRNGVSGDGFHVVLFTMKEKGEPTKSFVATVFDKSIGQCPVAVLELGMLSQGNIKFAQNSWRGDVFAPYLYDAIAKHDQQEEAKYLESTHAR